MKLDFSLISNTKINSKWVTDLYARVKVVEILEEIREINLDLRLGKAFSGVTPKTKKWIKERNG